MRIWADGRVVEDPTTPVVSALDHGLVVGDGVFEAAKVVDGVPFALTRHLQRLARSAQALGLPAPDPDAVRAAVGAVMAADHLVLGKVRITWTGGVSLLGSARRDDARPTLLVVAEAMQRGPATTTVATVPWSRNERGALAGVKSTSYAENVVALAHAHRHGASEAVFANTAGNLCEGTGSNVFYVVDGELRTPSLASGCLDGITRQLVLEWVGAREVDEPVEVLGRADEVFLASTTRDVQAVAVCDGRELTSPGPVTEKARATWSEREREDVDP